MRLQKETAKRITRDAALSILLYALPVVLMFLTFYIKGERPWQPKSESVKTTTTNK